MEENGGSSGGVPHSLRRSACASSATAAGVGGFPLLTVLVYVADEDTILEEAMDNLKDAGQRIRATQSLMRSGGMTDSENHRDLLTRLSTALAITEAAYLEARRRRNL
jgi:hypothetical protein